MRTRDLSAVVTIDASYHPLTLGVIQPMTGHLIVIGPGLPVRVGYDRLVRDPEDPTGQVERGKIRRLIADWRCDRSTL